MPEITKRRVTMTSYVVRPPVEEGDEPQIERHEAVDFVREDFLDAYVADAKNRWQHVAVSDEPDAGPGGYDGETHIPAHLDHPDAGKTYPANDPDKD